MRDNGSLRKTSFQIITATQLEYEHNRPALQVDAITMPLVKTLFVRGAKCIVIQLDPSRSDQAGS